MRKLFLSLTCGVFVAVGVEAQTAIGDSSDKTSLVLQSGGAVSVNFTDNSAKASYLYKKTGKPLRFGLEASGKAASGYASLFKNESFSPEASARLSVGYQPVKHETAESAKAGSDTFIRDQWATLQVGYRQGEYKLLDRSRSFSDQIYDAKQESPSVAVFYNALLTGNFLVGVSLARSDENNYNQLKKVSVVEEEVVGESGGNSRISRKEITAREGTFKEFGETRLNADIFWVPGFFANRMGIDLFVRVKDSEISNRQVEPGIGLFVLQKGAPTKIVAGITAKRDRDKDELSIGFVAGYNF